MQPQIFSEDDQPKAIAATEIRKKERKDDMLIEQEF